MFSYFLEHFKVEMLVFAICVAVSVGLVVQRMPWAAIPVFQQLDSSSPRAQCQEKIAEWQRWLHTMRENPPANLHEQWRADAGKLTLERWIAYCKTNVAGWTEPVNLTTAMSEVERLS